VAGNESCEEDSEVAHLAASYVSCSPYRLRSLDREELRTPFRGGV
jgi:hypothetical protein